MKVTGYFVVPSQVMPDVEEEFNNWYEQEHIPERQDIPGFLTLRRFRCVNAQEPRYLALYDLDSPEVVETPEYKHLRAAGRTEWALRMLPKIQLTRYICTTPDVVDLKDVPLTKHVQVLIGQAPPEAAAKLTDWFDKVHAPTMRQVPGVRMLRRLAPVAAYSPAAVIALYEIDNPGVVESAEYLRRFEESGSWRFAHYLTQSTFKVYEEIFRAESRRSVQ